MKKSGYKGVKLEYAPEVKKKKRSRGRKIIWFNPPYNLAVKTNIGKVFLSLVNRHFTKDNKLKKVFNRNNVKVSYSTMRNVATIINSQNKKNLKGEPEEGRTCDCRSRENCPVNNECLIKDVVYQAEVTSCNGTMTYYGLTSRPFKKRLGEHKHSFNNIKKRTASRLAEHIWELKDTNTKWEITWSIKSKSNAYKPGNKYCGLCLEEKRIIATADLQRTLNKRSEIISKCRHRRKFKLGELKV